MMLDLQNEVAFRTGLYDPSQQSAAPQRKKV